jgi:hypothetical protein
MSRFKVLQTSETTLLYWHEDGWKRVISICIHKSPSRIATLFFKAEDSRAQAAPSFRFQSAEEFARTLNPRIRDCETRLSSALMESGGFDRDPLIYTPQTGQLVTASRVRLTI